MNARAPASAVTRRFVAGVRRVLLEACGLRPGARLVVGVSGGADSMALLRTLDALSAPLKLDLVVVHVHHGLRGRAADADARWVEAAARTLKRMFVLLHCDVPARARRDRCSIEMAARAERYEAFAAVAGAVKADAVVVAHTADDQAETVLLQVLRKPGPGALAGMRHRGVRDGLCVLRPLLGMTRADIEQALKAWGQTWREDASNRDFVHRRNRVRHELLPLLEQTYNPGLRGLLSAAAGRCAEEEELLETAARRARKAAAGPAGGMRVRALRSRPAALVRRVIRQWLDAAAAIETAVTADALERVSRLVRGGKDGWAPVSRGVRVVREGDILCVRTTSRAPAPDPVTLGPGENAAPSFGLKVNGRKTRGYRRVKEAGPGKYPAEAWLDARRLAGRALVMRTWRPGDRIHPYGMAGSKKIQDVWTDAKIPRALRRRLPVVECDGEMVWIPGYRIAAGWAVPSRTAPSMHLRVTAVPAVSGR